MKVISIVGNKKSGKTTLGVRLAFALNEYGSVGVIKHIHGSFDTPKKDTYLFSEAGAKIVLAITSHETVKIINSGNGDRGRENGSDDCSSSEDLELALCELADYGIDFAVVEGFKDSNIPKIAIGDVVAENIIKRVDFGVDIGAIEANVKIDELLNLTFDLKDFFTLNSLILKVKSNTKINEAGAIGTFTGIVRGITDGKEVQALDFEKYDQVAEGKIKEISDGLKKRDGIVDVRIHHNTGYIKAGGDIVYIVVAGSHRAQVFSALSDAIELIKKDVPIWKKEVTVDGDFWVHDKTQA